MATHFSAYEIIATSRRIDRADELKSAGCTFIAGDLCDENFCNQLTKNVEIVVHCAAFSAPFGTYQDFFNSNVIATQTLLNASIENRIKKFIFISTPSIYFNFSDRFNVKESDPLPRKLVNDYARTKLMAEEIVLKKNTSEFKTLALRPRAIIGAEDTVIFPRILEAYHKGKLKIVGNGQNVCDFTCVHNVIESIICAINAPKSAYGEAYNITDGNPVKFWEALNFAFQELKLRPPSKRVSKKLAMFAARIVELKSMIFNEKKEPPLTKYGVGILSDSFTLDITKAKNKLNYNPIMQTFDGINEYVLWHKKQT